MPFVLGEMMLRSFGPLLPKALGGERSELETAINVASRSGETVSFPAMPLMGKRNFQIVWIADAVLLGQRICGIMS